MVEHCRIDGRSVGTLRRDIEQLCRRIHLRNVRGIAPSLLPAPLQPSGAPQHSKVASVTHFVHFDVRSGR
jgi:hypothetical protein